MATIGFVFALEQPLELVRLRKGWWIVFARPPAPPPEPVKRLKREIEERAPSDRR